MEQEKLIASLLNKDNESFTLLYDNYSKSLYGVIFNLVKNKEEAEDILQEVFVKIWSNIDTYNESKGRLYTWMLNITRNTTIDKLRSKGFNNSQKNLSIDNFVYMFEDHSSKLVNRLDVLGIKKFIEKLKPKCIQLIELLFFQEYTQQEVSDELEIPLGTVKTQSRNCINELRTMVNE
ncbi:MAG: RNA polymerase sigma factor [Flavobacterium sp.]|nr:RNA polymerase sigma factor [Flavobacteriaceae bacterium]MDK2772034.1 RNA polymerase sigma factor [Flavobacterium sp.]